MQCFKKLILLSGLFFHTVICDIGLRCDMIPEGVTAPRYKQDLGRYKIEVSGNPDAYVPGEQYTVFLKSSKRPDGTLHKFTHFILSVVNEKFERDIESETSVIGSLQLYGDASTKFSDRCKNAIVETDGLAKSEIQVLWIAPQKGNGCIKFKATVVESMDIWFSEDGELTKSLCEESPDSEDTQPKILRQCCTCDEAKYESDHIRTIIKARGISYPNITGKTFAVFRVDNRHHLMSIVSMIDPSPDWVVGVSNLELCLRNCSWTESKVLNLYPWDVGTDDGVTYMSPNQPSAPRQPIRRLRTNYPNDPRSPFFDPTGTPMKPLARLILSRQRLYEKSCDASGSDDSESSASNCETTEWSEWSPCSATCGKGMKYKQRRYKNEESKYICHRKLTERASCEAVERYCPPPVRVMEDPMCELGPWSEWSSCSVTCGKGVQTRDRKYKNRLAAKTCSAFKTNPPILQQNLECWGEEICDDYEEEPEIDCPHRPWTEWSPCSATCGKGFKERYRIALDSTDTSSIHWPFFKSYRGSDEEEEFDEEDPCNNLKVRETVECLQRPCPEQTKQKSDLACTLPKDVGECKSNVDRWYFDILKGNCEIFTYSGCEGNDNNFNTLEQCQTLCAKYQREFMLNSTMWKKHLGVTLSSVLQYNIQNDAINANAEDAKGNKLGEETSFFDDINLDCEVSKWSDWSLCNVTNGLCGWGFKEKRRTILVHPKNDGLPCPKKLVKRKKCHVTCQRKKKKARVRTGCVMSEWSPWSKCNADCENQYQHRFRQVLVYPKETGYKCQNEVEHRPCPCY